MAKEVNKLLIKNLKGLGTFWFVELFESLSVEKENLIKKFIKKEIKDFEKKYTRFSSKSLLNKLNHDKKISFDTDLEKMIRLGERVGGETTRDFNIFIKKDLEKIGYGKALKAKNFIPDKSKKVFYKKNNYLFLNTEKEIDLGGLGKGYLIDKLASSLKKEFDLKYFLINGGGDIYATSNQKKPIEIYLEHPIETNTFIGKVLIKNESFCASSSFKRNWVHEGAIKNHFIEKSGVEIVAASYTISKKCVAADMGATMACLYSKDKVRLKKLAGFLDMEYMSLSDEGTILKTERFKKSML
jgi:thiamine biosynthesis lipoprotein